MLLMKEVVAHLGDVVCGKCLLASLIRVPGLVYVRRLRNALINLIATVKTFVEGSCCPSWQCGPDCRFVKCAGPPNEWCTPVTRPLACCEEWNCRGCVDELGNHREVGSKWSSDSCNTSECTPSGVKVTLKYCPTLPKPHHSCSSYVPEGECCPRWECSACLDDNGEYHDLYSVWQETPCIRHQCTRAGIHTRVEKCSDQPHSNCEVVPNEGQCCQSWRCGADCSNVQCAGAPSSDCTSHRPPLACCDEWTCSGCFDLEEYPSWAASGRVTPAALHCVQTLA
nr:uncharacterized protein DDB_G0274171-like [Cherax quadricarinatus]